MRISFAVLAARQVLGGLTSNFNLANAMVRRGHDVSIVHIDLLGSDVRSVADIPWFDFDDRVQHQFVERVDYQTFPAADFVFTLNDDDGVPPARNGLPLMTIRAYGIFKTQAENDRGFSVPYPKVVPARWLVDVGRRLGAPQEQLVLIPNGIDHDTFRVSRPIENRPDRVSMVHSNDLTKGSSLGLQALTRVKEGFPDLEAVLFGHTEPRNKIPPWIEFRHNPPRDEIVHDIYNGSAVFISPSIVEGFGLPCIEAMACGCALATTDNGGSRDYALHEETALVTPPKDSVAMATSIMRLLRDPRFRTDLASRGNEYAKRFNWESSAEMLERFLVAYGENPGRYQA